MKPKPEDDEGWTKWQVWGLMATFGQEMYMAAEPLFEGNVIKIETEL